MRIHRTLLLLATTLLAACPGVTASEGSQRQTFYVASFTRTCQGMYEMQCMLVKQDPAGEWQNFYDQIAGFTYEPGYAYVLTVGWREIPNPPQDSSSREYWLIEVVEKKPTTSS